MQFGLSGRTGNDRLATVSAASSSNEIYPHEDEVERKLAKCGPSVAAAIKRQKTIDLGILCMQLPRSGWRRRIEPHSNFTLVERELGRGSMALNHFFGRPQNILMACQGRSDRPLPDAGRHEARGLDALAMTEPGAGSDVRGMSCSAGAGWRRLGTERFTKHFISGCGPRRLL